MNTAYRTITEAYGIWLDTLGFSEGLVRSYPQRVSDFLKWLQSRNVQALSELRQQHINEYFAHLEERPNRHRDGTLSIPYLNKNFAAVDKLLEFLQQQGAKNAPVPTGYRLVPDKQQIISNIQPFTQSEIKELYNNIENTYPNLNHTQREQNHYQLKLIFALYYGCGLRRSEGYRLTANDIDFEKRTVFVKQGKNYKDRVVPMSEGVYRELQNYIYNYRNTLKLKHKRLFVHVPNYLLKCLKHLQNISENEAIKSKRIHLHILRHSIATHLLQNGMSVENIRLFLGHSGLEATQVYTHIVNEL